MTRPTKEQRDELRKLATGNPTWPWVAILALLDETEGAEKGEAVAWRCRPIGSDGSVWSVQTHYPRSTDGWEIQPLYAIPVPAKVTEEAEAARDVLVSAELGPDLDELIERLAPFVRRDVDGDFVAPKDEALSDLLTLSASMAKTIATLSHKGGGNGE